MSLQFLFRPFGNVNAVPTPPDVSRKAVRNEFRRYIETWQSLFSIPDDALQYGEADMEDWSEHANRLMAAVDSGFPVYVIGRDKDTVTEQYRFNTSDALDLTKKSVFLGVEAIMDPLFRDANDLDDQEAINIKSISSIWPSKTMLDKALSYWKNNTIFSGLGRNIEISNGSSIGTDGYVQKCRDLVDKGVTNVFVKAVGRKQIPKGKFDWSSSTTTDDIQNDFIGFFEWDLISMSEQEECFLIQEDIPLLHEYRIFVCNGVPICGAGTIDELSSLYSEGCRFDSRVECVRGDRQVSRDEALVKSYIEFAKETARDAQKDDPDMTDYCLDLAVREDTGDIVVVEVNPILNAGLYAMDFRYLVDALIQKYDLSADHNRGRPLKPHANDNIEYINAHKW